MWTFYVYVCLQDTYATMHPGHNVEYTMISPEPCSPFSSSFDIGFLCKLADPFDQEPQQGFSIDHSCVCYHDDQYKSHCFNGEKI